MQEQQRTEKVEKDFYVYIAVNQHNNVIYVGVTNDLIRRMFEHRSGKVNGFTKRYNISKLVYFEQTGDVLAAISREKEIKKWRREKKNNLVESLNPAWDDLSMEWIS
ncbi:MAG: GIY-YIG nuclease family protein [Gammaproteobacteria bacterium]|jgi:putative endonuclease